MALRISGVLVCGFFGCFGGFVCLAFVVLFLKTVAIEMCWIRDQIPCIAINEERC